MLIFTALCLLCWMQFKEAMSDVINLEFYENSIDDMYSKCREEMRLKVFKDYSHELEAKEWAAAAEFIKGKKDEKILSQQEREAIHVYTENKNKVYIDFNNQVRTGKDNYKKDFKYHILHFLLTSAIQKLKENKDVCYFTYRRTKKVFKKTTDEIRFGSFTSSSLAHDQKDYGSETCFKIRTCHGAEITEYSAYPKEKEVLIPPYEVFKFIEKDVKELKDCKTVYHLETTGTKSNLDCHLITP